MIRYAQSTEKSIRMMESENAIIFIVDRNDTKDAIKNEAEKVFGAKVKAVRTSTNLLGQKKAIVTFTKETPAIDVATKLGMM